MRYLANQIDRAAWRNTLVYRLTTDLQLGVEYNPLADDLGALANWRAVRETGRRPAVILGTSSDRIGTPDGRAYYVTIAKALASRNGLSVSPYVGLLWSEHDGRFRIPFGASIPLRHGGRAGSSLHLLPTYDGHAFHPMLSYAWGRMSITGILVRGRDPGLGMTVGF